jgi:hypothetical protein
MNTFYTSQQNQTKTLAQADIPHDDQVRKRQMERAWKVYEDEFVKPLKVEKGEIDHNVISNRCAPIVDKGVSFLFGETIKIEPGKRTGDDTEKPDKGKEDFLTGVWGDADDMMTLLSEIAVNGGVCGQEFVKLVPAQGSQKYPRLVNLNPSTVRKVTDPEDCKIDWAYIIEYPIYIDTQKRQIIARVDPHADTTRLGETLDDYWTITNFEKKATEQTWTQVGESEDWLYPFAPIFTAPNLPKPNKPWGTPDLTEDIIGQNETLNFNDSNTSGIIYYHAHPKTIATGVNLEELKTGPGDVTILPSPESKVYNLEMVSNLESSRNFSADIRMTMDERSRVPAVALGRLENLPGGGDIPATTMKLMFQPLIEKTTQKRRLYGKLIREISRAALVLGGELSIEEYENYPIEIHWSNLLPVDKMKDAQSATALQEAGVSQDTALQEIGYDADEEAKKREEETKKKVETQQQMGMVPPPQQDNNNLPNQQSQDTNQQNGKQQIGQKG